MTITTASPSVAHPSFDGDVTVIVTFRPADPIGLTEVEIEDGAHLSPDAYLGVLTEAIARLHVYTDDYRAALRGDRDGPTGPGTIMQDAPPHGAALHVWPWRPRVIEGGRE